MATEEACTEPTSLDPEVIVSNSQFEFIQMLGRGTYGKVYVVKCLVSSILEDAEDGQARRILVDEEQQKKMKLAVAHSVNMVSNISEKNKARQLVNSQYYAIKEIETAEMKDSDIKNMLNEIKLLQKLNSHFIVGYVDSYTVDTKICIVLEYCQNRDLYTYLQKNRKLKFSENFVWKVLIHVCLGIFHLHS
jgi:serine/threonine protein kinase